MFKKLEEVEKNYERVQASLSRPDVAEDQVQFQKLIKEMASLEKVVKVYRAYKKIKTDVADNKEIIAKESDEDLREMAKEELPSLEAELENLELELKLSLLPKDPNDDKNIILEIRAGAGGDEAALFAEELFRAYTLFAKNKGWRMRVLAFSEGNQGGMKEIMGEITGDRVYSNMKYEAGVHRVQRVPKTETQGRVHTSTITVAVIPEVEDVDIKIEQKDLRIDVYRSSGNGGQSVNTTDSAVRITHLPTNTVVTCQDGKSQLSNKEQAMKVLFSRLQQVEEDRKLKEASDSRMSQIGTGDRSERIRTYNFPQTRVTDHRIGLTVHNLPNIMSGEMDNVVDALVSHFQAEALKAQSGR